MKNKILAVDDSFSVRKLVQYTLKSKGFKVGTAEDGQEALDMLQENEYDAIILDINMPRLDGLEFLKIIQSDSTLASIPVIMLTTEGQEEDKNKSLKLGASAYIVKPFKPTELLRLVKDILN